LLKVYYLLLKEEEVRRRLMTKVTSLRRTIVMKSIRKDAKLFSLRKRNCVSAAVPILKRDET
jgi:hypothetical protein